MNQVVLDLSRLLSRADRPAPTGIDRVEMAYAKRLIATVGGQLSFAALNRFGRIGALSSRRAVRFIKALDRVWTGEEKPNARNDDPAVLAGWLLLDALKAGEGELYRKLEKRRGSAVYLLVSHHHLEQPASIRRLKQKTGLRFTPLVHDLIPVELPEYAKPDQPAAHRHRMDTVAELADAVIVNSASTGAALAAHMAGFGRSPPVVVAPLGVEPSRGETAPCPSERPYFVCLATIEPKKNHLTLLNIWRRLALELGEAAPRLHLVGGRGWNNQNVVDMLERSAALKGVVEEHGALSDAAAERLLAGARALVFPSFAEGYGLPVAEALRCGTPVLCSDLPALRAVGGDAPEYLDPLDGLAWMKAVLDYADPKSARRVAQLARIRQWRRPTWDAHFDHVRPLIDGDR